MSSKLEEYRATQQKIADLREAQKATAKEVFEEGSKQLFVDFPELESFSWTQYTPYFNDGDACTFSCNSDYPTINGDDVPYDTKKRTKLQKAVVDFLGIFSEEDFLDMFDDHVEVTVTKDGATAEGYDHD